MINVAFAGMPVSFICPSDSRVRPGEIIGHAHSTHAEIAGPDAWTGTALELRPGHRQAGPLTGQHPLA
ncbi:MAG TPA: hypothetical protein VKO62_11270 [Solirubrobacterales bacterium]|nr:hypothetical protein [Solirubrobacterales bacterium]